MFGADVAERTFVAFGIAGGADVSAVEQKPVMSLAEVVGRDISA